MKTYQDKSVLLVDDEITICDFLSEYIQQKKITSFYATDIATALKTAQEQKIDVIFLDNNLLANLQSVDFIPEFKKYNQDCKIYMLTANSRPEVREKAHQLGAEGFIEKPFDFATLDKVLDNLARK